MASVASAATTAPKKYGSASRLETVVTESGASSHARPRTLRNASAQPIVVAVVDAAAAATQYRFMPRMA
jgi:hypothetical protein